ncbi:MAG: HEAT repeat domain-containing protein, partial [Anaerolineae bacterium]|nr:HEAT repeat domain-containing protein [Anaerolineae bacterium]
SGVGDGAYGALFNVVPAEKRAQVRAFDSGVPAQIGTILSGVLLILGERVLNTTQIFVMGMIVAVACGGVVWRMRRSHVAALVDALRAGRYDVFTSGEGVFSRFQGDADALRVVIAALDDPRAATQQLAAEMLARMGATTAAPYLIARLDATTPDVKAVFVRALAALGAREAAEPVAALLADPSPQVRKAALDALPRLYPSGRSHIERLVQPLLADGDAEVRTRALAALAVRAADPDALRRLARMLDQPGDARRLALSALESVFGAPPPALERDLEAAARAVSACLDDESPAIREAACNALRAAARVGSARALAARLADPTPAVRVAASQALRAIGAPASPAILAALHDAPDVDHDAALAAFSPDDPAIDEPLRQYAHAEISRLRESRAVAAALPAAGRASAFLAAEMEADAARRARRVVTVLGLLGDPDAMALVARNLENGNAESHAAALEALDMLGDRQLVKSVLPALEEAPRPPAPDAASDAQAGALRRVIAEQNGWLRALAVRAAGELELRALLPDLRRLRADADPKIRDTAHDALLQLGETMETLPTMSIMERVLLLKEVPLFKDLQPDDLGRIADIAHERWFADGDMLCREGDHGDELYILAAGRVRVTKQTEGHEKLLATRGVGEFIGEMAIIDAVPRFASVRAEGEARTLVITSSAFRAILRDRPEVALAVIHALSRRLREQV